MTWDLKEEQRPKIKIEYLTNLSQETLEGNLQEVRGKLSSIDYSKPGIHIIATQPGTGKSHTIQEFLKDQKSFFVVTSSHKLLKEEYDQRGVKHWKGFDRIDCKGKKIPKLKNIIKSKAPTSIVCSKCSEDKRRCEYHKQFNTRKAIAPYHYLKTNNINNKRNKKFKFDSLIVDESILTSEELSVDKDSILNALKIIDQYTNYEDNKTELFIETFDSIDFHSFEEYFEIFQNKRRNAINNAIEEENWDDLKVISELKLYDLKKFLYYKTIYEGIKEYSEPLLYYIFDLARQGIPITLLDATFDKDAFFVIWGRYCFEDEKLSRSKLLNKELMPTDAIKMAIYESNLIDKDVKIYRLNKDNNYFNAGFFQRDNKGHIICLTNDGERNIERINGFIKKVRRKHQDIAVITTQDLEPYFKTLDVNAIQYFHNLRGLNSVKNFGALFIIGTPPFNAKDNLEVYNKLCFTNLTEEKFYRRKYTKENGEYYFEDEKGQKVKQLKKTKNGFKIGGFDKKAPPILYPKYQDYEEKNEAILDEQLKKGEVNPFMWYRITDFQMNKYDNEIYQAVMRARLFRDNKKEGEAPEVFMFCYVPDVLEKEFDVIPLNNDETDRFFVTNFLGVYPLPLFEAVNRYRRTERTGDNTKIANAFNLKDKNGETNNNFVKEMREISNYEIERIDEAIRFGPKTVNYVRNRYKKEINASDEFIEYCIRYALKGNVIKIPN